MLVVDDFREAIPVWAVTDSGLYENFHTFMGEVHRSCEQDLKTEVFMSDMADNFYQAWCPSFTQLYRQLYCSWHVDKSWRLKINCYIKNKETLYCVYAPLKLLQNETDEKKNRKLFQKFLAESQRFSQNFILKRIMLMMTNSYCGLHVFAMSLWQKTKQKGG